MVPKYFLQIISIVVLIFSSEFVYGESSPEDSAKKKTEPVEVKTPKAVTKAPSPAVAKKKPVKIEPKKEIKKEVKKENPLDKKEENKAKTVDLEKTESPQSEDSFKFGVNGAVVAYLMGGTAGGVDVWTRRGVYEAGIHILAAKTDIQGPNDTVQEAEFFNGQSLFAGLNGKMNVFNSLYVNTGLSFATFSGEYGFSPSEEVAIDYTATGLWVTLGLGNRWEWGDFNLSCDWGGLGYLASSTVELKEDRNVELRTAKYFQNTAEERVKYYLESLTTFYLLQIGVGYQF